MQQSKWNPAYGPLQWGRIHADAEGVGPGEGTMLEGELQWGRIHADADAEGMALMGYEVFKKGLQWGRIHADAEGIGTQLRPARQSPASMGPHPCGCGGIYP